MKVKYFHWLEGQSKKHENAVFTALELINIQKTKKSPTVLALSFFNLPRSHFYLSSPQKKESIIGAVLFPFRFKILSPCS